MRIRVWMLLALTLFSSPALLSAEEPPKTPPTWTVGSVYGKAVTAADIGLSAPIDPAIQFDGRDTARWELMGRIRTAFGSPVIERFVKRERIEATRDEITKFKSNFRKRNERNLRQREADLVVSQRESRAADVPEAVALAIIVSWKIEHELHRIYGGRVIFQQAGPEALDGRLRLFEEAEKKGDISFVDAGVRHLFYYYANMSHTVIDEKALESPWFFEDGNWRIEADGRAAP